MLCTYELSLINIVSDFSHLLPNATVIINQSTSSVHKTKSEAFGELLPRRSSLVLNYIVTSTQITQTPNVPTPGTAGLLR